MGKFYSTKTYGNDRGLSCVFRQWRSNHSHCSLLHGYSIGVKVIFECETLDERNWVMDFGGLKDFKHWLEYMFDHTTLIAKDDPFLETFKVLSELKVTEGGSLIEEGRVCDLRVVDAVGCERFSELAYNKMQEFLEGQKGLGLLLNETVRVKSVEVFEHDANSAIYEG
jgi:6-pyruvoyltetrahydropterin/6-carboxytetrahydropterin synthase